ncbi:dTDP-glucose 4,6-dehydratase [Salibacterium qingdaonense]|uniref:dTDP-glucose 4,6-dehydratase n=1 Tax=Salibacterium qingdaonense TaxID=266892 RepID=A0A1I4HVC9_9BACI|nr:dTDP-glucose 4,6-dehydratase [Salibacterium qingdaonense]SFL45790.1 dTDP-glucose 4,6-dehydratase [Salibacterium qingdaonense]
MTHEKTIMVTGGAGFIGQHFVSSFARRNPGITILNVDNLTYAANPESVMQLNRLPNHRFVEGDITDRDMLEKLFEQHDVRGVIHFAAESHVDRSIDDPDAFIRTNVHGTFTLIDTAKNYWMKGPNQCYPGYEEARFHHISTDEVYGTLGAEGLFSETSPYAPSSPYSASKAGSDMIVQSYYRTYGLNTIITNCSNNYGPNQHNEKLIPTIIRKALSLETVPIYGDGQNIRDWLYVTDHCRGVELAYWNGRAGESYNIGGDNERTNLYIAEKICTMLDERKAEKLEGRGLESYMDLITYVKDRPGHDRRYAVDAAKIKEELGWKPEEDFESGLLKTVEWYIDEYE